MSKDAHDLIVLKDEDGRAAARVAIAECSRDGDGAGCDFPDYCEHKLALAPSDEKLRASLQHQLVLTGEASHRVKNSLQLLSSLLRIQGETTENIDLKRGLSDAQARIMAIAQVHHRLGHTGDIENVDLSLLTRELCEELQRSFSHCKLIVETDVVFGSPSLGNSLALMISELVTNACKYAYSDAVSGFVWVKLQQDSTDIILTIRDEGRGLPADFQPGQMKSLGMRLICSLVQQLRGSISVTGDHGACFTISIPGPI